MQCAHEGCSCQVSGDDQFCSDHCREHVASGPTGQPCACGHPECMGSQAAG